MLHDGQKEIPICDAQLLLCPGVLCDVNRHNWDCAGRCGAEGEGGSKINIVAAIIASEAADALTLTPRKPATMFTIHILAEYPTRAVAENELRKFAVYSTNKRQSKQNSSCF